MAQEVVWTFQAATDLEAIAEYIANDSPSYASAFVQEILNAGRSLSEFAQRGRVVPEVGEESIRELFVREYRLIYRIERPRVLILGIVHGKRDLNELWKRRKD